jgi:hypothetical protein
MSSVIGSFEYFGLTVSHAWESCTKAVVTSCANICDGYEAGKQQIVTLAQEKLSRNQAYLVERVLSAVPEVFVALSSLWAGILTIPALLVSWGRKVEPMTPVIQTIIGENVSSQTLGDSVARSLDNLNQMLERVTPPSLFVAFVVDAIYSFAVGWLAQDWSRMLHGTAISMPGAYLALRYMLGTMKE